LTITNATHGVTAAALLRGKPVVMIPITLEQAILAKRIVESGVGIWAYPHKAEQIVSAIESVIRNPIYRQRAQEFAARHQDFDAAAALREIAARIDVQARGHGQFRC
jgi:UDP:flavonoid glycosyltransferase YjiC (YdhE family)